MARNLSDPLEQQLSTLQGDLPQARLNLSEAEKDEVIKRLGGPRTALSLLKAKKELAAKRIPFVFSSLDTQAVVDFLANDMAAALQRAQKTG